MNWKKIIIDEYADICHALEEAEKAKNKKQIAFITAQEMAIFDLADKLGIELDDGLED